MNNQGSAATGSQMIAGGNATIFITDMDRSVRFYTESLGLTLAYRASDYFAMIDAGKGLMIGLHPPSDDAGAPGTMGAVQVGLNVTGPIAEAVTALTSRGVTFESTSSGSPVRDDGGVKLAFFKDPDGNVLYLCEVK